ncbi:MAG: pyrimidine dimer DNA glycosylase/endonuclease V [Planctomycetes bacterium]|nr:pyrimidine dimer DNA glycosylase/endonuclease V [Planctomycetota bacterium]
MRLWTLHPRYLDSVALVSVWRKALLARKVLRGRTKGYRNHPQLERFRAHPAPLSAINAYLEAIHGEARVRGYAFDKRKLGPVRDETRISATDGQLAHEWRHLRRKLAKRCPARARRGAGRLAAHPLFEIVQGPVEPWERRARS